MNAALLEPTELTRDSAEGPPHDWLARAAEVCERASRGDLEHRILYAPAEGDAGRLLHSINHLLDMTDAFVRESGASLSSAAQGRFYRRFIPRGMHGSFRRAAGTINQATEEMARQAAALKDAEVRRKEIGSELSQVIQTLAASATEMRATAETLSTVANQTTDQADSAIGVANQTSANMERVSSAVDEMRGQSAEMYAKTSECVSLASKASQQAADAGPIIENLGAVSRRVAGVVKLVAQIARQTNLLALNATIEAVRAGEAGSGFAVVAAEVKDLSRKTASATEEIDTEIRQMEQAAASVAHALEEICRHIQGVDRISAVIAEGVQRQRASADEIVRNVEQAVEATREVSNGIRLASDAARQTESCAVQMLDSADDLSRRSEGLHENAERFLGGKE